MIIGILFTIGLYLVAGIVGYIFNSVEVGIVTLALIPSVMVIGHFWGDYKAKKKHADDIKYQRGWYAPEEVERRRKKDELLKRAEELKQQGAKGMREQLKCLREIKELGYHFEGDRVVDNKSWSDY